LLDFVTELRVLRKRLDMVMALPKPI